ncbi:MAG: hypothetical protein RL307_1311 [Pseudomonadota bacterium]
MALAARAESLRPSAPSCGGVTVAGVGAAAGALGVAVALVAGFWDALFVFAGEVLVAGTLEMGVFLADGAEVLAPFAVVALVADWPEDFLTTGLVTGFEAGFLVTGFLARDWGAGLDTAFLGAGFLATAFLTTGLATDLAVGFLTAGFFATAFLATAFLATGLDTGLVTGFLATGFLLAGLALTVLEDVREAALGAVLAFFLAAAFISISR